MTDPGWYAFAPQREPGYGQAGSLQRNARFQGHIEADSGTLQQLSVKGKLDMGAKGVLAAEQTAYNTGTGFWLEYNDATPRLSLGNPAGNSLTWDGAALAINGSLTATSGTIGGWTIGATSLRAGSGATLVGMDSGGTNPAFHAGNATPGSAPFRVTQAGALVATSATITGAITATSGTFTTITINGVMTLSGASAKIIDGDGSYWDVNGLVLRGASGAYGDSLVFNHASFANPRSLLQSSFGTNSAALQGIAYPSTGTPNRSASFFSSTDNTDAATFAGIATANGASALLTAVEVYADGAIKAYSGGSLVATFATTNRALSLYGRLYPGSGSGTQTARYISDNGSQIVLTGDVLGTGSFYPGNQTTKFLTADSTRLIARLSDTAGASKFSVDDSNGTAKIAIGSDGTFQIGANTDAAATAVATVTNVWAVYSTGGTLLGYIPIYASYS